MTAAERAYYEHRAPEYDEWYRGTGLYSARDRPGWHAEVEQLVSVVSSVVARSVLDIACGTAFLTGHFTAPVTALDQSPAMLRIARERLPRAHLVRGDALHLPFPAASFDLLAAGHFYGHLQQPERARFVAEGRRVASRLLVIGAARREDVPPEQIQDRILNDGSRHTVYKRYFTPEQLIWEFGGGTVLHAGRWFVVVLAAEPRA